jgi:hypothetical protein
LYRATDTAFAREVAIKVLLNKFGAEPGAVARRFFAHHGDHRERSDGFPDELSWSIIESEVIVSSNLSVYHIRREVPPCP